MNKTVPPGLTTTEIVLRGITEIEILNKRVMKTETSTASNMSNPEETILIEDAEEEGDTEVIQEAEEKIANTKKGNKKILICNLFININRDHEIFHLQI